MTETKPARVWIELEWPQINDTRIADSIADRNALGKRRAALASAMLRRLGVSWSHFWWNEREQKYCITTDSGGSYLVCNDHGHWFNLDWLAVPHTLAELEAFNDAEVGDGWRMLGSATTPAGTPKRFPWIGKTIHTDAFVVITADGDESAGPFNEKDAVARLVALSSETL